MRLKLDELLGNIAYRSRVRVNGISNHPTEPEISANHVISRLRCLKIILRGTAAVKFFLYTMAGSVLMLAAIIYLYNISGTFDAQQIQSMLRSGRLALDSPAERVDRP